MNENNEDLNATLENYKSQLEEIRSNIERHSFQRCQVDNEFREVEEELRCLDEAKHKWSYKRAYAIGGVLVGGSILTLTEFMALIEYVLFRVNVTIPATWAGGIIGVAFGIAIYTVNATRANKNIRPYKGYDLDKETETKSAKRMEIAKAYERIMVDLYEDQAKANQIVALIGEIEAKLENPENKKLEELKNNYEKDTYLNYACIENNTLTEEPKIRKRELK